MNKTINNKGKKTFFLILVLVVITLTIILMNISLVLGANDPGHDTLYVEETGDSEITGDINITQNLSVDGGRIKQGGQLTLYGDGSTPSGSVTYISGTGASNYDLYLETQGNLYLKYVIPGDTVVVGTTGTPTIMNLTGALNLGGANRLYTSAGTVAGSDLYWGDKMLCDASETDCGWGTDSAAGGWTDGGTTVSLTTSTDNVSANTLKVDNTNSRIGIRDPTPEATVEIVNSSDMKILAISSAQGADGDILTVENTGDVGIGTNNPSYAIELGASSDRTIGGVNTLAFSTGADSVRVVNSRLVIDATKGISFFPYATNPGGDTYGTTVRHLRGSSNATDNVFLVEQYSGADLFAVKGSGKVGIGTTSPEGKLDIRNETADGHVVVKMVSADNANTTLVLIEGSTIEPINDNGGWLMYQGGNPLSNTFQIGTIENSVPFPLIYIPRGTKTVGINTSSPTQALDVYGNINSSGLCLYGDVCISGWDEINKTSSGSDGNNYTESISFTTAAQTETLNLKRVGMTNLTASFTDTDTTYSNSTGLSLSGTTFSVLDIYLRNTGPETATGNYTFGSTALHIDDGNDRVGIGTAGPENRLDIRNETASGNVAAAIVAGSNGNATLKLLEGAGAEPVADYGGFIRYIGVGVPNYLQIGTIDNDIIYPVIYMPRAGNNMSIGDPTPDALLDIQSSTDLNQLRVSYDDSNYGNFSVGSDGNLTIKATNHVIIDLS